MLASRVWIMWLTSFPASRCWGFGVGLFARWRHASGAFGLGEEKAHESLVERPDARASGQPMPAAGDLQIVEVHALAPAQRKQPASERP